MKMLLGLDGGGKNFTWGFVPLNTTSITQITDLTNFPAPSSEKEFRLQLQKMISISKEQQYEIIGVAIGMPGLVLNNRTVSNSPNLPWVTNSQVDFPAIIWDECQLPAWMDNDLRVATKAEMEAGLLKDTNGVKITLGGGLGGAIAFAKYLIGTEPGHLRLLIGWPPMAAMCGCGDNWCLEGLLRGARLEQLAVELCQKHNITYNLTNPLATVDEQAEIGTDWALDFYIQIGTLIGWLIESWTTLFPPIEIVVCMGGTFEHALKYMIDAIYKYTEYHAMDQKHKHLPIILSELGTKGAILGAALLMQENMDVALELSKEFQNR